MIFKAETFQIWEGRLGTGAGLRPENGQQELAGGLLLTQASPGAAQWISSSDVRGGRHSAIISHSTCSITQIRKPYPGPGSQQSIFHVEPV